MNKIGYIATLPPAREKLTLPPPPRLFHPNLMPFIGSNCDNAFAEENKKKAKMIDITVKMILYVGL